MAEIFGADLDAMDALADKIRRHVQQIDRLDQTVSGALATSAPFWRGNDADAFRHKWAVSHQSKLRLAGTALTEMAETVIRNREAQREASSADLGGGRPVVGAIGLWPDGPQLGNPFWPSSGSGPLENALFVGGWLTSGAGAAASILANLHYGQFKPRWPQGTVHNGVRVGGRYVAPSSISRWQRTQAAMNNSTGWQPKGNVANSAMLRARWQTVGRWATRAGVVVSFAGGAWSQWEETANDPSLSTANRAAQVTTVGATTAGGAYAGAVGGAQVGAFIGSLIAPGPGTVVGGVVGGLVGGFVGSSVGQWAGEQLAPFTGAAVDGVGTIAGDIGDGIGSIAGDVGDALSFWD